MFNPAGLLWASASRQHNVSPQIIIPVVNRSSKHSSKCVVHDLPIWKPRYSRLTKFCGQVGCYGLDNIIHFLEWEAAAALQWATVRSSTIAFFPSWMLEEPDLSNSRAFWQDI